MADQTVLEFVARLTELQLQSDPRASVVDVSRGLLANLAANQSEAGSSEGIFSYPAFVSAMKAAQRTVEVPAPVADKPGANVELVAPSPKSPEQTCEVYDPMIAVDVLPKFEALPFGFGTTDFSAIRVNDETAAISNEHYFDLLAIRDECKSLREDKARLEAMMIESARRHVAIEQLAKHGVYIQASCESVYVSALGVDETGGSLTECMERAVKAMDAMQNACSEITSVAQLAEATIDDQEFVAELKAEIVADEKWTDAEKQILRDAVLEDSLVRPITEF